MFENKLHSFSPDGSLLAICASNGVLKLWDTSSGILEHEFKPAEHLSSSATCLAFSPKVAESNTCEDNDENETPRKQLLAMGTVEGTILVYNPSQQEVVSKLCHSTTVPVTDLCWKSATKFVSLGQDKTLDMWDIISMKKLRLNVGGNSSVCALGKNRFAIASNSLHLISFSKKKSEKIKTLSGHKTSIIQLTPIILNKESEASYLLSAAQNDKFVYAWSTELDVNEPVASFMAMDIVRTFSCVDTSGSSIGITITTKKGVLRYFSHHLNGTRGGKPISSQGLLRINSAASKGKSSLSIISSHFLSATSLIVVYGTEIFPWCEILDVETLQDKVTWLRKDPSSFSKSVESALIKTITPHVGDEAVYLMPTHMKPIQLKEVSLKRKKGSGESVLPMEERLDALSLTKPLLGTPKGRPLDNYVHLLVQALHSKDSALLNNILSKGEDEEVTNNTVRRLPVTHVVPFLQYLQEVMVGKSTKNVSCNNWIKAILHHHMSYLSTVPDAEDLVKPIYSVFASRVAAFPTRTKLQSRINLILSQVKNRGECVNQKSSNTPQYDALIAYRDESSDEENKLRMETDGASSDSGDSWDDNFDHDDVNDHNSEINSKVKANKRKQVIKNDSCDDDEFSDEEVLESDDDGSPDSDD